MRINKAEIEALHALYAKQNAYEREWIENYTEDQDRATQAAEKSDAMESVILAMVDDLSKTNDKATVWFANRLLQATSHLSVSRYSKCLEVCGVELI
jgi:hypothetical protein